MRQDDNCGASTVILSFLVGGIVGAGLAMLYSPISGEEARSRLADFSEDIADKKEDYAQEARERLSDAVDMGKDFIDEKKSVIASAIEAGKDAYLKEKDGDESDA